ncbi:TonB-dependent receptor domain-containing protein [Capnocytophaga sp. oral taxon 338]|uniref:TonB-dependent receptor domain-containing protein n=1 Tax=Capnocytophaga sp. oral taxon 338 TaxID=710239 RepID=UPI000202E4C0|nr:TonB-dependent receptor protein [Capnocytophaga sp. oral taxon 338 str. F0234]
MIFQRNLLFIFTFLCGMSLYAQTYKIKGKVLDENKLPIKEASVKDILTGTSVFTDKGGNYSLGLQEEYPTLQVSKEGYTTIEFSVVLQNNENRVTYVETILKHIQEDISKVVELQPVIISDNPSLVANSVGLAKMKLDKIAGGTNLADLKDLTTQRSQTLKDALQREPGIIIQDFFGGNDQPRLNIRGSGIQSNPQSRGVALSQDGIPINFADGSYIIGVLEPQVSNLVEIYRGANALEHGGATLGGAMNFVTKNGYNASPLSVKMEAGSFNYFNSSISSGFSSGRNDLFVASSYTHSDGYRTYNSSKRFNALLNVGRKFTDKFEARLYASFTDLYFDIPGPLTRYQMETDSKQINKAPKQTFPYAFGPNVLRDKPNRSSKIARFGTKFAYQINDNNFLLATLYYQYADDAFTYPIANGIRQDFNNDYGVRLSYTNTTEKNDFTLGLQYSQGLMHQSRFHNDRGNFGALFAKQDLTANHAIVYVSDTYKITTSFLANVSIQGSYDTRKVEDKYTGAKRPFLFVTPNGLQAHALPNPNAVTPVTGDFTYNAINPKVGVIYKLTDRAQVFANFSRSYEPPTFLEIVRLTGSATPNPNRPPVPSVVYSNSSNVNSGPTTITISDLKAQKASTAELGTKGNIGQALVWNVSAYHSWVKDEIFTIADGSVGVGGNTVNTPYRTIHRGVEAGLKSIFLTNIFSSKEDSFTISVNYNYSDFFFDGGELKNNQIAGIPTHYVFGALTYKHPIGIFAEVNLESLPVKTPIDHKNTLYQDPYSLVGARIGYKKGQWTFFLQGNNLADKVYASSYLIQAEVTPPPARLTPKPVPDDKTNFIPGVGRNIIGGLSFTW